MSNTVQGSPPAGAVLSQGQQPTAQDSVQAKLDATGALPVAPQGLQQSDNVAELLNRAGLQQGVDGSQQVKDSAAITRGADGLTTAEQLYGTAQINPPAPPRIEITADLKLGAEGFAANIDQLANEALFRNGAAPADNTPKITESTTPFEAVNYLLYGNKLGDGLKGDQIRAQAEAALTESQDGIAHENQTVQRGEEAKASPGFSTNQQARTAALAELEGIPGNQKIEFDVVTGQPRIDPNITFKEVFSPENMKAVFESAVRTGGITPATLPGDSSGNMRSISELTADMLLALFLKLNINDPNNSVETHNKLHKLSTNLRQQGIQEARDKAKTAQEMMKEAEAYAQKAAMIGKVVMVIMIVLMVIVTVLTFGAAAPAAGAAFSAAMAAQASTMAAIQAAIQAFMSAAVDFAVKNAVMMMVKALIVLVLQIVAAGANYEAAQKSADASEAMNGVERSRLQAEKEQRVIEEEAAIMKVIMESKNQVIEAVIKMLNAMFAAKTKVMSAGMTR